MTLVLIGLSVWAAAASNDTGHFALAVANAVLAVWSNGVLQNYAGGPAYLAPDWAARVSMFTAIGSVLLLVAAFAGG